MHYTLAILEIKSVMRYQINTLCFSLKLKLIRAAFDISYEISMKSESPTNEVVHFFLRTLRILKKNIYCKVYTARSQENIIDWMISGS